MVYNFNATTHTLSELKVSSNINDVKYFLHNIMRVVYFAIKTQVF